MTDSNIRNMVKSEVKKHLGDDAEKSGAVLYNGWNTLCSKNGLYIMGFNPGGDPNKITTSVTKSLEELRDKYCSYWDECWRKSCPDDCIKHRGESRHQERVRSLAQILGFDIRETVAVNAVFLRSKNQDDLNASWDIFEKCWLVHEKVLLSCDRRSSCAWGTESQGVHLPFCGGKFHQTHNLIPIMLRALYRK